MNRAEQSTDRAKAAIPAEPRAALMRAAIAACREGIAAGQSPFGAAVATADGRLVCAVHNRVRLTCDPTAHAEVTAIREACRRLGTIDLTGCVMASTCEPCPMCASAIHWARFEAVYFGACIADAAEAGFNELAAPIERLYELGGSKVQVTRDFMRAECCALFGEWLGGPRPEAY